MRDTVFSEYEVRQMNFILPGADGNAVYPVECVGSLEEGNDVRKVNKKCRGVTSKSRTYGTGSGSLKLSAHMPYELYVALHGMDNDGSLAEGVYGYGYYSKHPEATVTAELFDEDANEKFKAWPACVVSTGPARKVTNGEEEVAETELEITFMPDSRGMGFYEALKDDIDAAVAAAWMGAFTPELAQGVSAADLAAAAATEQLIAPLAEASEPSLEDIKAARASYEALTAVQKTLVKNAQALADAEAAYVASIPTV